MNDFLSLKGNREKIDDKYSKPAGGIPKEDLAFDIREALTILINGGASGYRLKGKASFNSITGTIINHSIGNIDYVVEITPIANPNGYLGEYWVEKSNNNFIVKCSGTTNIEFDYVVF